MKGEKNREKKRGKKGEIKATISFINDMITKAGIDWSIITRATGIDHQKYVQMQKEYEQLVPVS